MADKADITPKVLRQLIAIDEETSLMTWKARDESFFKSPALANAWNDQWAGKPLGLSTNPIGYQKVGILKVNFMAHRVVFALIKGRWPDGDIDHINRNKKDNRIENLREVTPTQNNCNVGLTKANTSGFKGVSWVKKSNKWRAAIRLGNKNIWLGQYDDIEKAAEAYATASAKYHKEFGYVP